jgi:hypothetical protein
MAKGGRVRCTWFENGRRCSLVPVSEHRDHQDRLWAFLCVAHEYVIEKVTKHGSIDEIRVALKKAQGRSK